MSPSVFQDWYAMTRWATRQTMWTVGALPWLGREVVLGRVTNWRLAKTLYRLRALGFDGYYHNISLSDRYSTHRIAGARHNRPLRDAQYSDVLWRCIQDALGEEKLAGRRVVDLGPAEGFFTLAMARAGATVMAIHPPHESFLKRLEVLAEYFGLREQVQVVVGSYPTVGADAVRQADLVLCLGLLYHLDDLTAGLAPILDSTATVVIIEGVFYEPGWPRDGQGYARGFDPVRHTNNEPICADWLSQSLTQGGFHVTWIPRWQAFVERPGNLRHAGTRKLLIAQKSHTR